MYSGLAYLSLPSDSNMVLSTLPKHVRFADYALYSLSPQPEFIGAVLTSSPQARGGLLSPENACSLLMVEPTEAPNDEIEVCPASMHRLTPAAHLPSHFPSIVSEESRNPAMSCLPATPSSRTASGSTTLRAGPTPSDPRSSSTLLPKLSVRCLPLPSVHSNVHVEQS